MADYTFYTVPMSRGQIARWALHEAGADYEHVLVDWASRPPELAAAKRRRGHGHGGRRAAAAGGLP